MAGWLLRAMRIRILFILPFLTAGEYRFDVLYEGEKRGYIPPEYKYPADFLGFDRETKGQWGLAYGKDGYWLCGYPSDNAKQLPDYVSNIRFAKGEDKDLYGGVFRSKKHVLQPRQHRRQGPGRIPVEVQPGLLPDFYGRH